MCKKNLLNEHKADAICTLITFGFFKKESDKINIQYETSADRGNHELVDRLYMEYSGKSIAPSQSLPQQKMPYIVAQTKKTTSLTDARSSTDSNWTYINSLHVEASRADAPRGAYIGGLSKIGSMIIVGPSGLEQYQPNYRTIDPSSVAIIRTAYENAKNSTNKAIDIIDKSKKTLAYDKVTIDIETIQEVKSPYLGAAFKSYHGMIQVLAKYAKYADSNDFAFELAMGSGTTKVSSCVPCSIFMTAIGFPPTSIHLGRGDNWNIPSQTFPEFISIWEGKIKEYYNEGLKMYKRNPNKTYINNFIQDFNLCKCVEAEIPMIFLEALTFEKSFTNRIIDACSR